MIYISYQDLANTIRKNLWKIPEDINIIVGVPRSGMIPALMIAEYLNKYVTDLDSFINGNLFSVGRRGKNIRNGTPNKILVVDDTVWNGDSMQKVKDSLSHLSKDYDILYSCVYAEGKDSKYKVDIFLEDLEEIRGKHKVYYEWNIFQHIAGRNESIMFDLDGVICKNPPSDKDTEKYEQYIKKAIPMIIPTGLIGGICTYRIEPYRNITETWLKQNNVNYKELHMFNAETREVRNTTCSSGIYKGEYYKNSNWAKLFIESDEKQAEQIAKISKKPVYCYQNNRLY